MPIGLKFQRHNGQEDFCFRGSDETKRKFEIATMDQLINSKISTT